MLSMSAVFRGTSLLLAAIWLQVQEVAAFQTELLVQQGAYAPALHAEPHHTAKAAIKSDGKKDFLVKLKGSWITESVNHLKSKGLFPDKDLHGGIAQQQSSALAGKRKKKAWKKNGDGLIHNLLKLSSKGPPGIPDVLPVKRKDLRKMKKTHLHNGAWMYSSMKEAPQKPTAEEDRWVNDEEFNISDSKGIAVLDAILLVCFGIFAVHSFGDLRNFWILVRGESKEDMAIIQGSRPQRVGEPTSWSTRMLVGLTAYRFYTGFLTATWLPYLLAMEGQYLWAQNQSMFMGCAKLIYGATILTNPILGLVGDRAVLLSHGIGRRLFVSIGVALAAVGILICMVAADIEYFYTFMFGIFVWRMGEAINDVTTEALVPELVPAEQFQIASAVKAAMFLFGGLFGYLLLIAAARIHYSWLYYAYLVGMIVTCIPVLVLLNDDAPRTPPSNNQRQEISFSTEMVEAYLAPARSGGGFPRACLAVFIFSLGTAPMFFLLLIVRDIVGIRDAVMLQRHFSGSSIMFFVSASLAAVLSGAGPPRPPSASPSAQRLASLERAENVQPEDSFLVKSIVSMVYSISVFAVLCLAIPYLGFLPSLEARLILFYVTAAVFGYAFGLSFSQFQGITWQLLPQGIDLANAMGFNVMSRLLGLGVGNFVAGLILDFYYVDMEQVNDVNSGGGLRQAEGAYSLMGYITMCTASGIATLIAAFLAYSIAQQYRAEEAVSRKPIATMVAAG